MDALGIDSELVLRLESLFRMELERLTSTPIAAKRDTERQAGSALADCTGEDTCLAAIGKKLGVEVMVTGTVAALGDSYILDIKAVVVSDATLLRRIATEPLRGSPDELIEAIRVAAYRLLAPDQLHGSIAVLSDLVGASVKLDGKVVGTTPLLTPLMRVPLGEHELRLESTGYDPYLETVTVRFQKSTRVVVSLVPAEGGEPLAPVVITRHRKPWYSRWYSWVAVGTVAVLGGLIIGNSARGGSSTCVTGQSC